MVLDLSDSNTFADPKAEENRSHVCGILSRFSSGQQSVFKNVVARTRPYEVVEGLTRLIEKQSDYSFPSGHTAASFAAAVILFCSFRKIRDTGTHISGADQFFEIIFRSTLSDRCVSRSSVGNLDRVSGALDI